MTKGASRRKSLGRKARDPVSAQLFEPRRSRAIPVRLRLLEGGDIALFTFRGNHILSEYNKAGLLNGGGSAFEPIVPSALELQR